MSESQIRSSEVTCDLSYTSKDRCERTGIIEVLGISSSPRKMAFSTQQRHRLLTEEAPVICPVMAIDAGVTTDDAAATISFVDVLSKVLPAFCVQKFLVVHDSIYEFHEQFGLHLLTISARLLHAD